MSKNPEKNFVFEESQNKVTKNLQELGFKVASINQISGIIGASSFTWKGFFIKEKSVYLETSFVEMNEDKTLPEALQKKTDFLFSKGIICVFIFDSDFFSDTTLREAIYTRVLKAEAAKNAVKINDLTKAIYTNTFTKEEAVVEPAPKEVVVEEKKEELNKNDIISEIKNNIQKEAKTKVAEEKLPQDEDIIEKVLNKEGYIYKKDFKTPLKKEPKYWKEKYFLTEEEVYISYCGEYDTLKEIEKKSALKEKETILEEKSFIFLTKSDLFDETSLLNKLKKEISEFKIINANSGSLEKEGKDYTQDIADNFGEEPKEEYIPTPSISSIVSKKPNFFENDLPAIAGGLLIVIIILLILLLIFVIIYMGFFN